jgi:hypothetical protein
MLWDSSRAVLMHAGRAWSGTGLAVGEANAGWWANIAAAWSALITAPGAPTVGARTSGGSRAALTAPVAAAPRGV